MRKTLEKLRGVREREAAIARTVLMSASKAITGVAEKQGPRGHQLAACRGTILKRAAENDGDRRLRMLLLKRLIVRASGAGYVGYGPAVSCGDLARFGR
jgi:hypothetical protein